MRLKKGRERVRLVVSISSLQTAEHPCQHVRPCQHARRKPERLHLAQSREGKSASHSQEQWPWSGHSHGTSDRSLLGDTLCQVVMLDQPLACFLGAAMGCHWAWRTTVPPVCRGRLSTSYSYMELASLAAPQPQDKPLTISLDSHPSTPWRCSLLTLSKDKRF